MTNPTPLPALPDAFALFVGVHDNGPEMFGELYGDPKGAKKHLYSAEQMREYAESAIAALGSSMPSGEAVAEVCSDYELRWAGGDAIFNIVRRTGVKVGSKLYATHPTAAVQGGLTEAQAALIALGTEMVNITTTVRGIEEWPAIPAMWLDCMRERDEARAALSANAGSQQGEPVALDRGDAVNLARTMLEVRDCKGITSYGVRVLSEAVMAMDAHISATLKEASQQGEPSEFWQWLPKAYRDSDANTSFTAYNMEVAFEAGRKLSSATPKEAGSQPTMFADSDPEAGYIADCAHLNCPHCGGSGHIGDVVGQPTAAGPVPGYGDYARWAAKAGAKVNHDSAKPRITFDSMSDWRAFCDTVNSVISERPTAAGAVPTDEEILHSNYPDDEADAIIAAPDSELIAFGRAVLALAAPAAAREAQWLGTIVGEHRVGFHSVPTIHWEGAVPAVGTKLYAAPPSPGKGAK